MTWTRKQPTAAGRYWYRYDADAQPRVVNVVMEPHYDNTGTAVGESLVVYGIGNECEYSLSDFVGWWCPAEPPPFPGEVCS